MLARKLALPVLLATAAGTPYVVLEGKLPSGWMPAGAEVSTDRTGSGQAGLPSDGSQPALWASSQGPPLPGQSSAGSEQWLAGPPVADLAEVIRFDIPPAWVSGRWPRVTTCLAETGLQGLRVPLVTGTRLDDLAGSLTYYFDNQHRLQRLTFEGYTGDERRLAALVTQYYGLQQEPSLYAGMYVARWNGTPSSVLRISRAAVMSSTAPHAQLQVLLELNRPSVDYGLSPAARQMLDQDRYSSRW